MKKILIGLAAAAALITPVLAAATASADVPRCGGGTSTTTTATFTAWEPAHEAGQWVWNWEHDFMVTVNLDGSFSGTGVQNGQEVHGWGDGYGAEFQDQPVSITGKMGDNGTISYTETRQDPSRTWVLTDAQTVEGLTDPTTTDVKTASTGGDPVEWKISTPVLKTITDGYKNHGQFVSESGGGVEAARACTGMPLTSKKGQQNN